MQEAHHAGGRAHAIKTVVRRGDWAYPKMKPAPKISTMPGSSKDTLAVYMARNMAQPTQLF